MRAVLALLVLAACSNAENAGAEEAKRRAEAEAKTKAAAAPPAQKLQTPVPGEAHIPCSQLIDVAAYQLALGEKEPLAVHDVTKNNPDTTSSCSLVRGGKRPGESEQKAILKKDGKLGVLAGDELCNVSAYCSTIEDPDRFKAACKTRKDQDDNSLGSYACVHVVAVGANDVKVFRLLDEDTRCVLQVRGGPSNVNNELIGNCAKAARDTIGPAQIRVDGGGAPPAGNAAEGPRGAADGPGAAGSAQ